MQVAGSNACATANTAPATAASANTLHLNAHSSRSGGSSSSSTTIVPPQARAAITTAAAAAGGGGAAAASVRQQAGTNNSTAVPCGIGMPHMSTAQRVLQGYSNSAVVGSGAGVYTRSSDSSIRKLSAAAAATAYKTSYSSAYGSSAAAAQRHRPCSAITHAAATASGSMQAAAAVNGRSGGSSDGGRVSVTACGAGPRGGGLNLAAGVAGQQPAGQATVLGSAPLPYTHADVRYAAYGGVRNMASNLS